MAFFRFLKQCYLDLIACGTTFQHFLLLAIRLYWGYALFKTGMAKIEDINPISEFFESLGIPFPPYTAYVTAWIEFIGGICLFFGFASRLVALPVALTMVGALLTAHIDAVRNIFQDPQNFIVQLPFNYLLASLIVFAFGPGNFSVDYLLERLFFKGGGGNGKAAPAKK